MRKMLSIKNILFLLMLGSIIGFHQEAKATCAAGTSTCLSLHDPLLQDCCNRGRTLIQCLHDDYPYSSSATLGAVCATAALPVSDPHHVDFSSDTSISGDVFGWFDNPTPTSGACCPTDAASAADIGRQISSCIPEVCQVIPACFNESNAWRLLRSTSSSHSIDAVRTAYSNYVCGCLGGSTSGISTDLVWPASLGPTPSCNADLAVVNTTSSPTVSGDSEVSYNVNVDNLGDLAARGITLTDTLPDGFSFTSMTPLVVLGADSRSLGTVTCTRSGNTISCNFGLIEMPHNAAASMVVRGTYSCGSSTSMLSYSHEARVSSSTADSNSSNNSSRADVSVDCRRADLSITKTVDRSSAQPGDPVVYTLHVVNNGALTARTPIITDILDAALTMPSTITGVSASSVGTDGHHLEINLADLNPGNNRDVVITTSVSSIAACPLTINNQATISSVDDPLTLGFFGVLGPSNNIANSEPLSVTCPATTPPPNPTPLPPPTIHKALAPTSSTPAAVGSEVAFDITVSSGTEGSSAVRLQDILPHGLTYLRTIVRDVGPYISCSDVVSSGSPVGTLCQVQELPPSTEVTIRVFAQITASACPSNNTAYLYPMTGLIIPPDSLLGMIGATNLASSERVSVSAPDSECHPTASCDETNGEVTVIPGVCLSKKYVEWNSTTGFHLYKIKVRNLTATPQPIRVEDFPNGIDLVGDVQRRTEGASGSAISDSTLPLNVSGRAFNDSLIVSSNNTITYGMFARVTDPLCKFHNTAQLTLGTAQISVNTSGEPSVCPVVSVPVICDPDEQTLDNDYCFKKTFDRYTAATSSMPEMAHFTIRIRNLRDTRSPELELRENPTNLVIRNPAQQTRSIPGSPDVSSDVSLPVTASDPAYSITLEPNETVSFGIDSAITPSIDCSASNKASLRNTKSGHSVEGGADVVFAPGGCVQPPPPVTPTCDITTEMQVGKLCFKKTEASRSTTDTSVEYEIKIRNISGGSTEVKLQEIPSGISLTGVQRTDGSAPVSIPELSTGTYTYSFSLDPSIDAVFRVHARVTSPDCKGSNQARVTTGGVSAVTPSVYSAFDSTLCTSTPPPPPPPAECDPATEITVGKLCLKKILLSPTPGAISSATDTHVKYQISVRSLMDSGDAAVSLIEMPTGITLTAASRTDGTTTSIPGLLADTHNYDFSLAAGATATFGIEGNVTSLDCKGNNSAKLIFGSSSGTTASVSTAFPSSLCAEVRTDCTLDTECTATRGDPCKPGICNTTTHTCSYDPIPNCPATIPETCDVNASLSTLQHAEAAALMDCHTTIANPEEFVSRYLDGSLRSCDNVHNLSDGTVMHPYNSYVDYCSCTHNVGSVQFPCTRPQVGTGGSGGGTGGSGGGTGGTGGGNPETPHQEVCAGLTGLDDTCCRAVTAASAVAPSTIPALLRNPSICPTTSIEACNNFGNNLNVTLGCQAQFNLCCQVIINIDGTQTTYGVQRCINEISNSTLACSSVDDHSTVNNTTTTVTPVAGGGASGTGGSIGGTGGANVPLQNIVPNGVKGSCRVAPANEADLIVADPQRGSTVYGLATDGTCLPLNIIYTPPQLGTLPAITIPYNVVFMQNGGQSVWMTSNTSNSATPPVSTEVTAAQPRYLANALASIDSRELSKTVCGPIDYEHSEHQANFIVTAQTIPSRSSDAAVTLDTVECSVNLAAEAMGSGAGCRGCSVNASHQVKRDALINMIVFFSFSSIAWWAMKKKMLGIR